MTEIKALTVPQRALGPIADYLSLKKTAKELDAKAEELREQIVRELAADGAEAGTTWLVPGVATVTVVNGRSSERLDRARLAKAGVSKEVLDEATVRIEGKPSMRITPASGEGND